MPGYYDPFGRPLRQPSQLEYRQLVQACQNLQAEYERAVLMVREQEAALSKQGQRIAQLEAELQRAGALLAQRERSAAGGAAPSLQTAQQMKQAQEQASQQPQVKAPLDDDDWHDRYLRLQADLDNYKRRQERRFAQAAEEDRQRILRDMLPLADNLERGLKHLESQPQPGTQPTVEAYGENMRATLHAFLDSLRGYGIEPIDALGQPFDPNLHEAIGYIPSATIPDGHVAQIVQSGYTENEKLLRPARVLVSSGQPAAGLPEETEFPSQE